jgi:DNA-binding MarR family transcriptional regulator
MVLLIRVLTIGAIILEEKKKLPVMSRLGVVFLTWRRYLEKTAKSSDLTLKQFYILRQLIRREYLNPSDIAEQLYCDRPTATVVIDNLVKYGYVIKERDQEDGKRIQVKITDKGRNQVKLAADAFDKMPKFDPLSCFTEVEKATFEELLIKLNQHIKNLK